MGIIASADKSAWTAVGDVASDEACRGKGKRDAAAADKTTGRPRGDIASVDEALLDDRPCGVLRGQGHGGEKERGRLLQTMPRDGLRGHRLHGKVQSGICHRESTGDSGGRRRGEPRLPSQMRPQDGR